MPSGAPVVKELAGLATVCKRLQKSLDREKGAGHPHNTDCPPKPMALITSDCGATGSLGFKWP